MANEIHIDYDSSNTLYAIIRNVVGQVWYVAGQVFEDWAANGHDVDDYDITLIDKGGNRYVGDFDANVSAGRYTVQVFLQTGTSPSGSDILIGSGKIIFKGGAELTVDKILANKAIQNKLTGAINYYDDDGQTIILTHTPNDSESDITRIPS
jgi:hypothetical protein